MKKTSIFFAIATIALLSACRKENFNAAESTPGSVTVIGVGINDVKTTMGAPVEGTRKIYWANGDVLQANGLTSAALADLPEECTSARFTFDGTLTYPANLLYPADYYKDESTITLPLEQPVTPKVALYGYMDEEGDAQMNALLAYVHIPLTQGEDKDEIKTMTVESLTDGYCLGGDFTIDYETGALTPVAGASNKVSVLFNKPLNPEKATDFFAAVPAGENVKLSVKFRDSQGHCMTKTVTRTFAAGKVVSLPDTEFVPTTTEFDVVITTAAQFVQFAKDYNDGKFNNPLVQLGSDIVFDETTSAEFVATGGIGVEGGSNYFNGTLDGNGRSIKNLVSSVSLFNYVGSDGFIKNIIVDSSSEFNFSASEGQFGTIAGRLKGSVSGCTVNSDVTIGQITTTNTMYVGGVVGRVYGGKVENCSMTGDVTFAATSEKIANAIALGGVVGQNQNDNTDGSEITGCTFSGNITVGNAGSFTGPSSSAYVYIGGITGTNSNYCKVSFCTVSEGTTIDVCGVFKNRIGGICGSNSGIIEGEEGNETVNNASIKFTSNGARADTTPTCAGGICGYSDGESIAYCTNNGPIETLCNSTTLCAGGIVSQAKSNISHCTNGTGGKITRNCQATSAGNSNRYMYIGGIVGYITTDTKAYTISEVENKAEVVSNRLGVSTANSIFLGGVAGFNECVGAIIENSANAGFIHVNDATTTVAFPLSAVGGIIGASNAEITVSSCTSAGKLNCTYSVKIPDGNRPAYTGGIAGLLDAFAGGQVTTGNGIKATISDCSVTGGVQATNFNNNVTGELTKCNFVGGIVGAAIGKDKEDNAVTISGCSTSSTGDTDDKGRIYCYRGFSGGVAGYIKNGKVTGDDGKSFAKTISANGNAQYGAGLVGVMVSSVFDGCVVAADKIQSAKNMAGFVANIDAASEVKNCILNGTAIAGSSTNAVFAITSADGAKFTDNGVKGTIGGAAITLGSTFIYSGSATISGTYLLD